MTHKMNHVIAGIILIPLLGFLTIGLIIFAWPVFVAAAVVFILSLFFSLFKRK